MMNMHTFYTPDIEGRNYTLSAEESKHAVKVLRLKEGDAVELVDGKGGYYNCRIKIAAIKACMVEVVGKIENHACRDFRLHIAMAPVKNMERMEWMMEKCTEIGMETFTPVRTERSERDAVKTERLLRVAVAALKQSHKALLPEINPMVSFEEFIENVSEEQRFIAYCGRGEKKGLFKLCRPGEDTVVLIGPEGDFSSEEVDKAVRKGFIPVSLGNSVLRTETAAVVACHTVGLVNEKR